MVRGGKIVEGRVAERGKGVGTRRVGEGGGVRGARGARGWNLYLNEVFNKTGIVTLSLFIGMHITGRNRPKSRFSGGFPKFWQGIPNNDIIFSQKRHVLAPKTRMREISAVMIVQCPGGRRVAILEI